MMILAFFLVFFLMAFPQQVHSPKITAEEPLSPPPNMEITEFTETIKDEGKFIVTFYSYQKYYNNGSQMVFLNESFDTENCKGFEYCIDNNLYQIYVSPSLIGAQYGVANQLFNISMNKVGVFSLFNNNLTVNGSIARFDNFLPGVHLEYQYLPWQTKERIIVEDEQALNLLFPFIGMGGIEFSLDDNFLYEPDKEKIIMKKGKDVLLTIGPVKVFDSQGTLVGQFNYTLDEKLGKKSLRANIKKGEMDLNDAVYPIIIDPTLTVNVSVAEDVHIRKGSAIPIQYTRQDFEQLRVGPICEAACINTLRAGIDWNIGIIPDTAEIVGLNLTLHTLDVGEAGNGNISIMEMDGNSTIYDNTNEGNEIYYNDMGDGTLYIRITGLEINSEVFVSFNLINATNNFTNRLLNDSFSIGIITDEIGSPFMSLTRFQSSEASNAKFRPRLEVTYRIRVEQFLKLLIHDDRTFGFGKLRGSLN